MEREQFLGRVKSALRGGKLPDVDGPGAAPRIHFDDPVTRFVEAATAVNANVIRVADASAALDAIDGIMGDTTRYIAWDGLDGFVPGWQEHAVAKGWERIDASVGADTRLDDLDRVGSVTVGITGADLAIAATGTVVLAHGAGRPRSSSLLVEDNIVLVPAERVVQSLGEVLAEIDWDTTSNVVAITGPSRTGDIDSILTLGVHGPRHLHIVLID